MILQSKMKILLVKNDDFIDGPCRFRRFVFRK